MPAEVQRYTIVVRGEIGAWLEQHFAGMQVRAAAGHTEISGPVADAAQLHGLIDRVGELGLELVRVNPDPATVTNAAVRR